MKLSKHSKKRMRERTPFNSKERKKLFREALSYGKSPNDITDYELHKFMASKQNCKVKLYKDYIFIYSKNSHMLYTMYELPENLKEVRSE